jgi:hypothetical protein
MCVDCGCGHPDDRHGDDRHITMSDIRAAAEASEVSVQEVAARISKEAAAQATAQR